MAVGVVVDEFVFETAPFLESHASTIAETPKGLVAAWFGGTKERNPDVCIWVSRQVNGKWTAPQNVADGIVNDKLRYARSHQMNGKLYLGEYQDEKNGRWLKGYDPRSKFYNHSGYADLIISDLVGIKPRPDDVLDIRPLLPNNQWEWFCLDKVLYHGKSVTVLWDKTGKHYKKGKGLRVFVDGKEIGRAKKLEPIKLKL